MTEPEEKPFRLRSTQSYMIGQDRARKYAFELVKDLQTRDNPYGELTSFKDKLHKKNSRHTKEFYRHLCKELCWIIEAFIPSHDTFEYGLVIEGLLKLFDPQKQD